MRAHIDGGDDDGGGGDDADERLMEDVEAGDDDDDIRIRPPRKTGGRGRGRSRGVVRGRSVGRGGKGGASDDGGKSATYRSPEDQMLLVRCKREQDMHLAGLGHNYGRMRTKEWKWDNIAKRMGNVGGPRDANDCMKKWDNLFQNYKKIQRFLNASGQPDFFRLSNEERKEHNFKFRMERVLYNEIHAGMARVGGGESVGSESGGEGFPEGRSSVRDSDNNAGSGVGGGKQKNAREQALESIADVMDRHGELMSSTIESSSKRQCGIFTRQCDILEQEVAVQKVHYAASDETQRMMCHALMEIVATIRGRSPIGALSPGSSSFCPPRVRRRLLPAEDSSSASYEYSSASRRSSTGDISLARSAGLQTAVDEAFPAHPIGPPSSSAEVTMKHVYVREHRGKKRDEVPDDSQGQGRGRRHVPKTKRVCLDDASARVPPCGAQGWAAAAGGDYDEDFTTEEEQAEATASAVWESGRQRSSDHSAPKRMLTPPPEAQQLRARERRTEKAAIVDLGGDDDEPLEKRHLRTRTIATPPTTVVARAAVDERPVMGRLPATPSQPRQRNPGDDGGSALWPPVATAREEAAVVATTREDARGEKKTDREGCEAGSSRVQRGVMTKDLIDRAVLWVDDKAFWTTGEGRRLHETRECFVAIASGLPPPAIPRSVVQPKSSTRVARITDQSQLQQAISRAVEVENIALRILHDWVFKSGNRPRGYNVAFQYSLESVATNIARAMWYIEEWCNVVSPAVCAHMIDLSMDLPLWFADANIEDRSDDDDMAAHQESTVICVAHAFRVAVQMGALIDGDFISYDHLCRVADCFRLLLAASMWIMRIAGDDPRSHYEAFYFVSLVAKPTLVAAMHRSFDHRRFVVRAVNVVTERLGKANATLGEYPDYIPQWAPYGIGFRHDVSTTGPEDAKKLDWLGSGPPDDDNNDDEKDDA
ncbi:hypothetical protein CBR_g50648 [Chara braunii]|uniref:Myb-like domain-containing protein n=1 Tax=Chara braunii TaxID=69332 RepID=A0A388M789_CHABU|nr:hypothetical protein CBR_g50648 [Chara braunii]|eukprot:GBG90400.1 hypothetical protein CBR_g50648 [Chara braunii]